MLRKVGKTYLKNYRLDYEIYSYPQSTWKFIKTWKPRLPYFGMRTRFGIKNYHKIFLVNTKFIKNASTKLYLQIGMIQVFISQVSIRVWSSNFAYVCSVSNF